MYQMTVHVWVEQPQQMRLQQQRSQQGMQAALADLSARVLELQAQLNGLAAGKADRGELERLRGMLAETAAQVSPAGRAANLHCRAGEDRLEVVHVLLRLRLAPAVHGIQHGTVQELDVCTGL
jgi:hypothetical protein